MTVFAAYSRYYDLLYQDKDYRVEADFVAGLIRSHAPEVRELLELGCGTGHHAALLAGNGFSVHGVDRSEGMLEDARRRREQMPEDEQHRLDFSCGDVRDFRLGEQVDAVISLFHVMSYMSGNDDLRRAFATARAHLRPGGIFLFDCWYGPAVLTDRPAVRVKRLAGQGIEVTRIAEPVLHPNDNLVDVNYDIQILDQQSQASVRLTECHTMRYLFLPEIREFLEQSGFELVTSCEWLTGSEPGFNSWNLCVVGKVVAA